MTIPAAAQSPQAAGRAVVQDGRPAAVVVIADEPTAVSKYAAQELVYHVEKATGAKLTVVSEGASAAGARSALPTGANFRIYLGETRASRAAGIDAQQLAPETFVLRSSNNALYIVGKDASGDPLDTNTFAGTLFGVYEWLERDLGVRWVWPGSLGTYVPHARTVTARTVNEKIAPKFFQRNVRGGLTFTSKEHPELGFSPKAAEEYAKNQTVFLRRNRMGRGVRISYGHAFVDWWAKYGAEHPEWFQLVDGKRGPTRPGASYSMCVSNPEFQKKIVELWREKRATMGTDGPSFINAVENGIMGLCECENCKAMDGPEPVNYMKYYLPNHKMTGSRFVTDRYAKFWLAVQAEAAKTDPDVTLIAYNYFNYFHSPSKSVKLHPNILVGSYPSSGWFPRSADEHEWFKQQWKGWHETGARLFSRGNYCLDGYNMPFIFAHQYTDEFHNQVRNGMEATDYDALTGQWSTQGPNLYVLMRLHIKPDASADELLAEYYSAFGPAATQVKEYFDYWERYTSGQRETINRVFGMPLASRWRAFASSAHVIFPQESFAPAEAMLAKAATAAVGNAEAMARVEFLQKGLAHAKLSARVSGLLSVADPQSTPERGKQALDELIAFRRVNENSGIANFNHSAWTEDASWALPKAAPIQTAPAQ
jgi:hypothetical protein